MPSACVKTEMKTSSEALEPIGQALSSVEKKIRNLEKKRQKLDGYREKKVLNEDQRDALSKYESLMGNLEFAREMQKHLAQLQAEAERSIKKQAKRESHERQLREIQRTKELLGIQSVLDSFGPEAKEDFKNSTNGAVSLTEGELNQLDELYKLISPTRGEGNYEESSLQAGEHIVNLLDAREKEVIGTTYKNLRELFIKINGCGYFDKTEEEETEETPAAATEEQEKPEETPVPAVTEDFPPAPLEEPAPTQLESAPVIEEKVQQQPPPQQQTFSLPEEQTPEHTLQSQGQAPAQMTAPEHQGGDFVPQDDSFFTTPAYQATAPRPFQEIVSSVQGSFNFLQESEIEHANAQQQQQQQAGRVDPAVVAVIPGTMNTAPAESYQSQAFSQETTTLQYQQTNTQQEAPKESLDTLSQQAQLSEAVPSTQALPTNTLVDQTAPEAFTANTDQGFGQQSYSSLTSNQFGADQSTLSFRTEPTPATFGETSFAHVAAGSQNTESGPPQPIPMPPRSYDQQQQDNTQLNPNADIFRSMLTQPSDTYPQSSSLQSTADSSNQDSGSGFGGGYRNRGDRGSRGGPRGGNMSNGYRGRDNRGGYNSGGRGGYNQRQGGRGGSTYQGYPPRDNYRPEGFQGYNNGFSQGKRGGPGNSGGMGGRGGQSRGGMRGGRGGGYGGRPNSGHSQQAN